MTFALVDCNSFYASCERIFRPDIKQKPVVVLSNNDGCVVALSKEAKQLGIKMCEPWFKIEKLFLKKGGVAFSSNYELYADVSSRVMQTLEYLSPKVEVYSIDEAFLDLSGLQEYEKFGYQCKETIDRWIGVPVCVGIRPLIIGSKDNDLIGKDYMIASESNVLDSLGYEIIDDIHAGSAVFISSDGRLETESCINNPIPTPCIFEYVYLARPDAKIDQISVHKSRLRMGEYLAKKIINEKPDHDIDVVIPIPDSSTTSALQLATTLGIKYREGFVKNRYIGRTFIMPFQQKREKSVKQKLNPIDLEFRDKVVLLVDDSIVRGTTSRQIIEMARASGAKKVYFASAAPPIRFQNVYGIDMAATTELVAHQRTEKEIEAFIKADWLIYQNLDDLISSAQVGNEEIKQFECSIFTGKYVTDDIDDKYLQNLEELRSDKSKSSRQVN